MISPMMVYDAGMSDRPRSYRLQSAGLFAASAIIAAVTLWPLAKTLWLMLAR